MCGIVGYIGDKEAYPILINGLKRLEYRGYDSAGVALLNGETLLYKRKGKVSDLESFIGQQMVTGKIGMGHTRWATHGEPNDVNAHPHASFHKNFIIIHNGIIENYARLKEKLIHRGYEFQSETDTEVLANLIEYIYLSNPMTAEMAVRLALSKVVGAYGLVVMCKNEPDKLIAARKGSPLVIGVGQGEYFLASDATPIVEYTKSVIYMNDDDVAVIQKNELQLKTIQNQSLIPNIQELSLDIGEIDKMGFDHFMLKEIYEQPKAIADTFRGRITPDLMNIHLGGLHAVWPDLEKARRIIIVACGTSWHAGLVGEYLFEEFARIPVEVEYGSEFRYRKPVIYSDDVVIAISQSGETADTLAAIRLAKEAGAMVLGICNVVGSSIPRETDAGVYTHAGPEIGVASTKAFTAQVTVLTMMALKLAHNKYQISNEQYHHLIKELTLIPEKIERALGANEHIKTISKLYKDRNNAIYLGRGFLFPVALEGALKLKEISYIHAEGYPAAEMKHGPIALIDENMPVVVIATKDSSYEKIVSNIQEVKARNGIVIAVVTEGDDTIKKMANHVIEVPETPEHLAPLMSVIPLQLLSYHIAVMRGCNVDQPRNLAKSVTVE
ncbi:MAG TPA: glutamine--fructose-6-phosphate transaminase (isomerizing) [Marinilabiliales bacterium]|jgi:glucosamine--fructose-6-phosphate aminotransferase (isomerizing)|nr:MAG: glutamine--fructose-6-phosphate aminotransferase [Bacteroidetes bacterium GWA2_40_14]OFX62392.1 MAG: glutamine--fructose-6-phosphate aminotransferase [Bacteroidetes bacterium GWC2_40_13]OFX73219.1 MAG: glutamine--fructose-6-phosphate aminotransferase [Bacteroidetes bacterium GWD2_40_43]OFX92074.1 MAG: glutamine--fructose-6-phosphate aminotransferase [Bacteroidetes bacterium GWE2_40_63]OFY16698.1 MAG: glutamine--fructose-6-phosphate aminotransferase [Bacteroidetes bacterium GWF2_40_13]O